MEKSHIRVKTSVLSISINRYLTLKDPTVSHRYVTDSQLPYICVWMVAGCIPEIIKSECPTPSQ